MYTQEPEKVTVGELIDQLKLHPRDKEVVFGGSDKRSFYRVKDRGGVTQIEFNEAEGVDYSFSEEK